MEYEIKPRKIMKVFLNGKLLEQIRKKAKKKGHGEGELVFFTKELIKKQLKK